jgi:calcium-dependent protein kinase
MHSNSIVHRDIKPENILMEKIDTLDIKLTDFGFATYFDKKLDEVLGSPIYMPPEIVDRQLYDQKVDIWSAGVVTYIMLCGKPPFLGDGKAEVYKAIKTQEPDMYCEEWKHVSPEAKDFVQMALNKDPNQRPSAKGMLDHTWLQEFDDKIKPNEKKLDEVSMNLK